MSCSFSPQFFSTWSLHVISPFGGTNSGVDLEQSMELKSVSEPRWVTVARCQDVPRPNRFEESWWSESNEFSVATKSSKSQKPKASFSFFSILFSCFHVYLVPKLSPWRKSWIEELISLSFLKNSRFMQIRPKLSCIFHQSREEAIQAGDSYQPEWFI